MSSAARDRDEAEVFSPYDIDVEQALLGALFVDNRLIDVAAAALEPGHFYDPVHARIFEIVSYLRSEGAVSPLLVAAVMKTDAGFKEVGGVAYLSGLAGAAPAMPPIADYARVLRNLAIRRELIAASNDVAAMAVEPPGPGRDAEQIASEATEAFLRIGQAGDRQLVTPYAVALESIDLSGKIASGQSVPLIRTGISKLDTELGGLGGGELITVPAKSGMGKSTLMGELCLNTAMAGVPTIFFSLEMMRNRVVERMVCSLALESCLADGKRAMWYSRVRNGKLAQDEFSRFGEEAGKLHGLPLEIHDEDHLTLAQITARARAFQSKHKGKMGVVVLDYIQIINPGEIPRGTSREQVVNGFARGLKALAKRLNWPVVAGSQMNESAEGRSKEERRPQGSDVRESKGIFNESDLMISPYRPAYFVENRRPDHAAGAGAWDAWKAEHMACAHELEILGLKNRNGRRFSIDLWCEIGASAIRDRVPAAPVPTLTQAELEGLR